MSNTDASEASGRAVMDISISVRAVDISSCVSVGHNLRNGG